VRPGLIWSRTLELNSTGEGNDKPLINVPAQLLEEEEEDGDDEATLWVMLDIGVLLAMSTQYQLYRVRRCQLEYKGPSTYGLGAGGVPCSCPWSGTTHSGLNCPKGR